MASSFVQQLINGLDDAQHQAVTTPAQQVLVLASAGSGKTLVLTRRLIWLVWHAPRAAFLAVTFTNRAAQEMRERVTTLLGAMRASWEREHLWISTFHRFCVRLLRRHGHRIGIPQDFIIADEYQQRRVYNEALQARGIDPKQVPGAFREFSRLRVAHPAPPETLDPVWQNVWNDYLHRLRNARCLDFNDLQHETIRLLETCPDLCAYYRAYFHTILVDEFQDTNPPQYRLFRLLRDTTDPFFVVGDQDQSIYSFRGACPEHFRFLLRDYPDTTVIPLRFNYRSRDFIVRSAMQLIAGNPDRISHKVQARDHGGRMTIFGAADETEEADWICQQIRRLHSARPESAIAVLVRARSQLPELERAFQAARLPYVVVGLRSWWDSPPIRVVLDYIAFCAHPEVDAFLSAVCNVPPRGIGPKSLAEMRRQAGARPMWTVLQEMMAENPASVPKRWRLFVEEMSQWIHLRDAVTPQEWLQKLIAFLREQWVRDPARRASYEERWRELLHVVREVREWEGLAEQLSLQQPEDLLPEDGQRAVYIMTVHSAKGLEFDHVFIPGVEDGLFPHFLSRTEPEQREERRVFFVAITRARAEVFLSWAASRRGWSRRPSPFLRDMPLEEMHVEGRSLRPWFPKHVPRARGRVRRSASQRVKPIRAGDLVEHAHYGRGIVRSVTGTGSRTRVRIWFFRGESREFLLNKAPIRILHSSSPSEIDNP